MSLDWFYIAYYYIMFLGKLLKWLMLSYKTDWAYTDIKE